MYWYGTTQNPTWNIANGINPEPQSNAWNMNNGGSRVNNNDTASEDMFEGGESSDRGRDAMKQRLTECEDQLGKMIFENTMLVKQNEKCSDKNE